MKTDRFYHNHVTHQRGRLICEAVTSVVVELTDGRCWVWPLCDCQECR